MDSSQTLVALGLATGAAVMAYNQHSLASRQALDRAAAEDLALGTKLLFLNYTEDAYRDATTVLGCWHGRLAYERCETSKLSCFTDTSLAIDAHARDAALEGFVLFGLPCCAERTELRVAGHTVDALMTPQAIFKLYAGREMEWRVAVALVRSQHLSRLFTASVKGTVTTCKETAQRATSVEELFCPPGCDAAEYRRSESAPLLCGPKPKAYIDMGFALMYGDQRWVAPTNSRLPPWFLEHWPSASRGAALTARFEHHITVRVSDEADSARFHALAATLKLKTVSIDLPHGATHIKQEMTSSYANGSVDECLHTMYANGATIAKHGFTVLRLKMELQVCEDKTMPYFIRDGVGMCPLSDKDTTDSNPPTRACIPVPENYFEFHTKVLVPRHDVLPHLRAIGAQHGAHLSRNALKCDGPVAGGQLYFLTQRMYHVGFRTALPKLHALHAELDEKGYKISTVQREFAVYDSNIDLDHGWLRQTSSVPKTPGFSELPTAAGPKSD